ncbi:MAG: CDP-2,3-bis-(O-geranylgeranyl)-sn-glycerol synthase [Candidatus Micrarchaeota archaeon]|nr:CDP-2,3-bis-(O-geranylgeranyl)-sn-glycerol synthase [Candidatus Micrarchaeota archaeon]
MADLLYAFLFYPILFILPAWIANGAPVVFGGGAPLDFNKKLNGRPIFGKHKTIRGTVAGLLCGFLAATAISLFFPYLLAAGLALSIGTIAGDLAGSFIKRQTGLKEGASVMLLDQYSFFVVALLFSLPFGNTPSIIGLVVLAVLTGVLHKGTNMLAHKARIKQVPW